jgi:plastocyanin
MIRRATLAVALLLLVTAAPVAAATKTVETVNFAFQSKSVKIALGDGVRWHNGTNTDHTATANNFGLWNFFMPAGANTISSAFVFQRAGQYAYRCVIHPTQMKGTVSVKMRATPTSGTRNTTFVIRAALSNAPSGFIHDIQLRKVGASFAGWRSTTLQTASFVAPSTGTFEFRARLRKTSDGSATGYSPALRITVN